MLVQMLTERVANGGTYNLTFGESLTMAGIGVIVVFIELLIIAGIVLLMGKLLGKASGKKADTAPAAKAAPAAAPVKKAAAPTAAVRTLVAGYRVLGPVLSLCGVDDPTAAMVMAITADKLGTQPSELSFRAIRAIELPENLNGIEAETAAEVVSKCATENGFTLDEVIIKSINFAK